MDGLLVLKEETVATSLAGLVCDPSTFIVEEYSEEVGDRVYSSHDAAPRSGTSRMQRG